jgi:hypothetical protein
MSIVEAIMEETIAKSEGYKITSTETILGRDVKDIARNIYFFLTTRHPQILGEVAGVVFDYSTGLNNSPGFNQNHTNKKIVFQGQLEKNVNVLSEQISKFQQEGRFSTDNMGEIIYGHTQLTIRLFEYGHTREDTIYHMTDIKDRCCEAGWGYTRAHIKAGALVGWKATRKILGPVLPKAYKTWAKRKIIETLEVIKRIERKPLYVVLKKLEKIKPELDTTITVIKHK